jgi:hypothetical protein
MYRQHVPPVDQRNHAIRPNDFATQSGLLLGQLRRGHLVNFRVLRFRTLGFRHGAQALNARVAVESGGRDLGLAITEVPFSDARSRRNEE